MFFVSQSTKICCSLITKFLLYHKNNELINHKEKIFLELLQNYYYLNESEEAILMKIIMKFCVSGDKKGKNEDKNIRRNNDGTSPARFPARSVDDYWSESLVTCLLDRP